MSRRRVLFAVAVLLALAAAGFALKQANKAASSRALPAGVLRGANVLLVTIDTLRADRVGAYGSSRDSRTFVRSSTTTRGSLRSRSCSCP